MGSQLLQNMEMIKQTDVSRWKIWRIYGSVSYLFSCNQEFQSWTKNYFLPILASILLKKKIGSALVCTNFIFYFFFFIQ